MPSLERESAFFDVHRAEWIDQGHEGAWAVVHGKELLGFYESIEAGYAAGRAKYEPGSFLLKQVTPRDEVETIQRAYWGACDEKTPE